MQPAGHLLLLHHQPLHPVVNSWCTPGWALWGRCWSSPGTDRGTAVLFPHLRNQYTKPFNEISGSSPSCKTPWPAPAVCSSSSRQSPRPPTPLALRCSPSPRAMWRFRTCSSPTEGPAAYRGLYSGRAAAQLVALVGPTGCGKTSLINLLIGFTT